MTLFYFYLRWQCVTSRAVVSSFWGWMADDVTVCRSELWPVHGGTSLLYSFQCHAFWCKRGTLIICSCMAAHSSSQLKPTFYHLEFLLGNNNFKYIFLKLTCRYKHMCKYAHSFLLIQSEAPKTILTYFCFSIVRLISLETRKRRWSLLFMDLYKTLREKIIAYDMVKKCINESLNMTLQTSKSFDYLL